MSAEEKSAAGLPPEEWEARIEQAVDNPKALAALLAELEHEMHQERAWVHDNPTPGKVFKTIFRFFGRDDRNLEQLAKRVRSELDAEHLLQRRYRSWLPGESWADRLFAYLKDFGAEVHPDDQGLQFDGFAKYKGIRLGSRNEAFAFYLDQRFPGRDPANFHLSFAPDTGELVIERVYKLELPRSATGPSPARAVLAELVADITPAPEAIRSLVVDNAANLQTRQALLDVEQTDDGVCYRIKPDANPDQTPLGRMLRKLAAELGLNAGDFSVRVNAFGVLKLSLPVGTVAGH